MGENHQKSNRNKPGYFCKVESPIEVEEMPGSIDDSEIVCEIVLSKKEDLKYAKPPADITFVVTELEDLFFKRNGVDIHYTAKLTQKQFEQGCELQIPTLEEGVFVQRKISQTMTDISSPKRIFGLGLPFETRRYCGAF